MTSEICWLGDAKILERHQMNNKRFVLTVNEDKLVQLWKLDECQMVREFPGEDFNQVKERLDALDMKHSP